MKTCVACETQINGVALSLLKVNTLSESVNYTPNNAISRVERVKAGPVRRVTASGTPVNSRWRSQKQYYDAKTQVAVDVSRPFAYGASVAERIQTPEGMVKELKSLLGQNSIVRVKRQRDTDKKFVIFRRGKESPQVMAFERVSQFLKIEEFLKNQSFPNVSRNDNYKRFWESLYKHNVSAVELSKHTALKKVTEGVINCFKRAFGEDFTFVMDGEDAILTTSAAAVASAPLAQSEANASSAQDPAANARTEIVLGDNAISRLLKKVTELQDNLRDAAGADKEYMAHFPGLKVRTASRYNKNAMVTPQSLELVELASTCQPILTCEEIEKLESKIDSVYDDPKRFDIRVKVSDYVQALEEYLTIQKDLGLPESLIPENQYFGHAKSTNPFAIKFFSPSSVISGNERTNPFGAGQASKVWDAAVRVFAFLNRSEFTQSANYVRGASQKLNTALASAAILGEFYNFTLPDVAQLVRNADGAVVADNNRHRVTQDEIRVLHENVKTALDEFRKNDFLMDVVHETMDSF